jgi:hypothetical protein
MRLSGTNLVRLGAVHAVGLAALALVTPAHAVNDPPPPLSRAAAIGLTSDAPDDAQSSLTSALIVDSLLVDKEIPANMPPPASVITQAATVRQSWTQVISPMNAQKSPERASANESRHRAVSAPSDEPQYHPRHVQYQLLSNARRSTPRLVLPTAVFLSRESKSITPSSSPIESRNWSRNVVDNCLSDRSWSPYLPADNGATSQCAPDPPADEATSDDAPAPVDCDGAPLQYQPDGPQYQTPAAATCDAVDDPVVPISEPQQPVSAAPESTDAGAATSVVSPTAEPVNAPVANAPVAPDTEPTHCGTDVLPAPASPPPATTKVTVSRLIRKPNRPRLARSGQPIRTDREIPARIRPVSPSVRARPLAVHAPSKKPTTIAGRKIEATAPRGLEPTSSRASLFEGWFVSALSLSLVFALSLLLMAVALAAGRLLRARVGSKGLSDRSLGMRKSGGIRYRE